MKKKYLAYSAAAFAAALLSTALAAAQTTQSQAAPDSSAPASQTAKPSPYQGVSAPPPDNTITTSEEPPAQPKAAAAPPAAAPAVKPAASANSNAGAASPPAATNDSIDADDDDDAGTAPELKTRSAEAGNSADADSDDGVVTYVPAPANALPEGTPFRVRMLQDVDASVAVPGTPFRATLSQDLMHNGRIVVPYGSELRGRIVYTTYGRRIGGRSVIHLRADEFILPDGTHYALHAQVIDTFGSDTKVIGEGNIASKDHPKVLLTEVAAASGGGALVGAYFGGPAGAAVGSAVGAGFIGTHWLMADHAVYVPAKSTVTFSLTDPMFLTPSHE